MADRIGQRLGNYTIVQLLGQGGFAEVYLGEHLYLKSQAAIKILQTRLSGSDDTDSFLKEAQTIARLAHPNIVRVMDFGIDGETPYLVMDYAPNGTLRQRHPRGTALPSRRSFPMSRRWQMHCNMPMMSILSIAILNLKICWWGDAVRSC
ncbi:serine/threonine protein kinase [Dictyobacter kobayashii]|uniref:Protein kinase domain-containing protein n=1 Tax=Dictyobacter kobayashii TaxID=2014872 RepID=A0A402ANL1_9CHLR|nr:protein kinase [Dictyobacter kobayashii]GCE20727.1 hypothetical protein KDK_45270 [Dictyobacter kobayashii]